MFLGKGLLGIGFLSKFTSIVICEAVESCGRRWIGDVGGGAEQQQVLKCKGLPSEKQNLVSSKESTPAKDTGTTVTRPRSQFNSGQSIESDKMSPPHDSVPALMGRGNWVDAILAVVGGGELGL